MKKNWSVTYFISFEFVFLFLLFFLHIMYVLYFLTTMVCIFWFFFGFSIRLPTITLYMVNNIHMCILYNTSRLVVVLITFVAISLVWCVLCFHSAIVFVNRPIYFLAPHWRCSTLIFMAALFLAFSRTISYTVWYAYVYRKRKQTNET